MKIMTNFIRKVVKIGTDAAQPKISGIFQVLSFLTFLSCVSAAQAQTTQGDCSPVVNGSKNVTVNCNVGSSFREGVFLFEQQVELFWNEWWAIPLKSPAQIKKFGQAELTVRAEGKTVDFVGSLSLNCETGKHFWRGVENFYTPITDEADISSIVPDQIYRNSWKLFCRDNLD